MIYQSGLLSAEREEEESKHGFVYLAGVLEGLCKIGQARNPVARVRDIAAGHPGLELLHAIPTSGRRRLEGMLHQRYAAVRRHGEWFALSAEHMQEIRSWVADPYGIFLDIDGKTLAAPLPVREPVVTPAQLLARLDERPFRPFMLSGHYLRYIVERPDELKVSDRHIILLDAGPTPADPRFLVDVYVYQIDRIKEVKTLS